MQRIGTIALSLFAITTALACGEAPSCGPEGTAQATIAGTIDGSFTVAPTWADWRSSPNNDCTQAGGPTSLTVEATQSGTDGFITLCIPRPDMLGPELPISDESQVQIIDVSVAGECTAELNRGAEATGAIGFSGVCDNGENAAGYAIDLDAVIPLTVDCNGTLSDATMTMRGMVSVQATVL